MQHTPAPEYDAETIDAAAARVAAMNLSADKPSFAAEINAIREETKDLPPLDIPAQTDEERISDIAGHGRKLSGTKPERKTITVDLTDEPETYAQIKELAEDDDRTPAAWLRRYTVARYLAGHLKTPPAVTK